ncbi:MAG: hypothetical protein GX963_11985 [Bacteroidales bacterium]|nr:hypothetical protein [Bacteroidales bacterium]
MSRCIQRIKYICNQIRRFRYRKGFGVHSPFAFRLITEVIYESYPYYSYSKIRDSKLESEKENNRLSFKMTKLLFRLVNEFQPTLFLEVGPESLLELPVTLAKEDIHYLYKEKFFSTGKEELFPADFVFIHHTALEEDLKNSKDFILNSIHSKSLLVISGIGYSKKMKAIWKDIQQDERVGITFDLYDVGLVFFDRKMNKQHYLVKF